MSRTIKDPALGDYAIKQDYNNVAVLDKDGKQVYKCMGEESKKINEAIEEVVKRRRLVDDDKTLTLREFQEEHQTLLNNITNAFKDAEVAE
jgi:hypothetical protein